MKLKEATRKIGSSGKQRGFRITLPIYMVEKLGIDTGDDARISLHRDEQTKKYYIKIENPLE